MKVAVSSCLLGIPCRFDGEARKNDAVIALCEKCDVVCVCPETFGGLTRPRDPSEVVGPAWSPRVVSSGGEDVTAAFVLGARRSLEKAMDAGCKLAVFKSKSPSCACGQIFDGTFSGTLKPGYGIATRMFREAGIRVLTECQVEEMRVANGCFRGSTDGACGSDEAGLNSEDRACESDEAGLSSEDGACVSDEAIVRADKNDNWPILAESSVDCPALETTRLLLKPITRNDENAVFEYCRVPEVGFAAGWPPHKTIEDTRAFIDEIASAPHVFGIFEKMPDGDLGPCTGSVGLIADPRRRNPDCLMLGYALAKSSWGKGYMPEAASAVLRYGFDRLALSMVTSNCYAFNMQSERVLEKLGFVREGMMRAAEPSADGFMRDLHMFSLTREEFEG